MSGVSGDWCAVPSVTQVRKSALHSPFSLSKHDQLAIVPTDQEAAGADAATVYLEIPPHTVSRRKHSSTNGLCRVLDFIGKETG